MRRPLTTSFVASGFLLLAGIGTVQAETTWTGCVTASEDGCFGHDKDRHHYKHGDRRCGKHNFLPWHPDDDKDPDGRIVRLAKGPSPASPCGENEVLIQLHEGAARQTPGATYDQAATCEAFHELKLPEAFLKKLGCPSDPNLTKPGTLTRVVGQNLVDNSFNVCGILQIDQVYPERTNAWQYVLPKAFAVSFERFPSDVDNPEQPCLDKCEADDKCIAAQYEFPLGGPAGATGLCTIFHHSDAPGLPPVAYHCGLFQGFAPGGLIGGCANNITNLNYWWVRVPAGQSVGNCSGAPAVPIP